MEAVWLWILVVLGANPRPAHEDFAHRFAIVGQAVELVVEDAEFQPRHHLAGFRHIGGLLFRREVYVCPLHQAPRQGGQRARLRHAPTLDHLDAQGIPIPADERWRRRRTATSEARQARQVVGFRARLVGRLHALPDGRHARRDGDLLIRHQPQHPRRVHEAVRHHLLAAEHQPRPRHAPAHHMEHGHDAAHRVGCGKAHGIRHANGHRVEVLRAMLVFHALRPAGGAAGVAEAEWRGFRDAWPFVARGLAGDERLVVHRGRGRSGRILKALLHGHHDSLHGGNAPGQGFEQRQRVRIRDDDLILGVVDDVLQIMRREPDVQRVQHRAHAGHGVVRLQMPRTVPHEGAHPVTDVDAGVLQRVGELMCAVSAFRVSLAACAGCRGGDDLDVGRQLGAAVDEMRHQEGGALHGHESGCLRGVETGKAASLPCSAGRAARRLPLGQRRRRQ